MTKRILFTGALLTALATIGCSDYVFQPEDGFRSEAGSAVTPPSEPRIDVVRNGGDSSETPAMTPPDVDMERVALDSPRDEQATIVPPSPPRIDVIEAGKIEMQRP